MARIPANQAAEWLQGIVNRFQKDVVPGMKRDAAARGVTYIVSNVIPETLPYPPVDTGQFRAGFREADGNILHSNPKLFRIIDRGVPKENVVVSRKMIDALTGWVQRKFGVGDITEARQMAIAIARGIKRRGLPPKRVAARTIPFVRAHLVETLVKWWRDPRNLHT